MTMLRRHPLLTFFALTFAITWGGLPFGVFLATGPFIAAVLVAAITGGRAGLRELGARLLRWRVGWRWYAVAIGLPVAVHLVAVTVNMALGAPAPSLEPFRPWWGLILVFAVRLVNPLNGPVGEEPGWRGFAQPGLQAGRSPLVATAILAVLVVIWHVPLFFLEDGGLQPSVVVGGILGPFASTFWYAWVFNRTGGSALMTVVSHAVEGTIPSGAYWAVGAAAVRMPVLYPVVLCVLVVAVVAYDWQFWSGRAAARGVGEPAYAGERRADERIGAPAWRSRT